MVPAALLRSTRLTKSLVFCQLRSLSSSTPKPPLLGKSLLEEKDNLKHFRAKNKDLLADNNPLGDKETLKHFKTTDADDKTQEYLLPHPIW